MAYDKICSICEKKVFYSQWYTTIGYVCYRCVFNGVKLIQRLKVDMNKAKAVVNPDQPSYIKEEHGRE